MPLALDIHSLRVRTAAYCAEAAPQGGKIKLLRHLLNASVSNAERVATARMLTLAQVTALARHFGKDFVDFVFADVVGERPSAAELAEVEAWRRDDEQAVVALAPAPQVALVAQPCPVLPSAGGRDCEEAGVGYSVTRRSLGDIASRKSHLAAHLRRWSESLGLAERSSLVEMAKATPQHRTSITTQRGEDLIYGYISPAFRLHSNDREKLIGRSTTDTFDKDYAQACATNTRNIIASGKPAVDDVRARVKVEPGVFLDLSYRRLILPTSKAGCGLRSARRNP